MKATLQHKRSEPRFRSSNRGPAQIENHRVQITADADGDAIATWTQQTGTPPNGSYHVRSVGGKVTRYILWLTMILILVLIYVCV